jgi:hypothetical protein
MKNFFLFLTILIFSSYLKSQDLKMDPLSALPYVSIEHTPENYSGNSVLMRMIDGLGYRYYWGTEGLRPEDLAYDPGNDGATCDALIKHIHGLSEVVYNTVAQIPTERKGDNPELTFTEYRSKTLNNLKAASELLRTKKDLNLEECLIQFKRGETVSSAPFWNLMNGPLADAIYHTGQIVSYRRTTGNPINPLVSVFSGKNRSPKK